MQVLVEPGFLVGGNKGTSRAGLIGTVESVSRRHAIVDWFPNPRVACSTMEQLRNLHITCDDEGCPHRGTAHTHPDAIRPCISYENMPQRSGRSRP